MYILTLKKGEEKRIETHPWVYANEVAKIEGKDKQGSIAKVVDSQGRLVGYGFINHLSKSIVRILSRKDEVFDESWFEAKVIRARRYRETLDYGTAYRAVFAESDDLPGFIVDRYGDYLSVQFLCLGMEVRKEMIVEILKRVFQPKGIYERSDVSVREKEGLTQTTGVLYGEVPDLVEIEENGVKMTVDIKGGQKTGYFLDQKENRANIRRYAKGKTVLDCFCNLGGFGMCAASVAKEVTEVDISETALDVVKRTAALNGFDNVKTVKADVFEYLRTLKKEGARYDVIVLDPPAFTKSKDTVGQAIKGYKDINILALKLLSDEGVLITCSCSQHLSTPLFLNMLEQASKEAGRDVRLVELRQQARDHATKLGAEEATYLKVAVLIAM